MNSGLPSPATGTQWLPMNWIMDLYHHGKKKQKNNSLNLKKGPGSLGDKVSA